MLMRIIREVFLSPYQDTSVLQLQPPQLEFLLRDLVHKLEHVLVTTTTKRRSFLKVGHMFRKAGLFSSGR